MSRSLNEPAFQYPDSAMGIGDSSSSTNSSAPSTPALPLGECLKAIFLQCANIRYAFVGLGHVSSPYALATAPSRSSERKFTFPDAVPEVPDIVLPDMSDSEGRTSDWTSSTTDYGEGPSSLGTRLGEGSEGTVVIDSTGSGETEIGVSDGSTVIARVGHLIGRAAPQTMASWNEVAIPFHKIDFDKNAVVRGRFGYVQRGYHFGDVAIKFLNMDHIEESRRLDEFKSEVAAHKNTRHDNIVLFLGYCLEADKYGIVMSYCKGPSLYYLLHEKSEPLDIGAALVIATQICQGVSYLHQKKILHKDLRSKNIFIEISGYNFIITIWFELLTSTFPFAGECPDRIIWMVGNGLKAPLYNLNASPDVKVSKIQNLSVYAFFKFFT
ncbi:unnamed protein product [Strongylus vulgaris]|uniref:Protein kinase domain-containing protein n=1 Tax=Strongylus vulgaris TaxID=40348 RepID=A0A3P7LM14_STRVU|nr:unnamed protein product [Strongylus vulgaris]